MLFFWYLGCQNISVFLLEYFWVCFVVHVYACYGTQSSVRVRLWSHSACTVCLLECKVTVITLSSCKTQLVIYHFVSFGWADMLHLWEFTQANTRTHHCHYCTVWPAWSLCWCSAMYCNKKLCKICLTFLLIYIILFFCTGWMMPVVAVY